jgi:hypothetical protein
MTLILSPNICLLFFRDPEARFTPARLKKLFGNRVVTAAGRKQPFGVRWGEGPTLYISITRGEFVETLIRRLMGRRRKHRHLIPGCDTQIEITFDNLDEVLNEINTLIDIQATLQDATGGLLYRSWNDSFSGPED